MHTKHRHQLRRHMGTKVHPWPTHQVIHPPDCLHPQGAHLFLMPSKAPPRPTEALHLPRHPGQQKHYIYPGCLSLLTSHPLFHPLLWAQQPSSL